VVDREGNAISSSPGLLRGLWHSTRKQDSSENHEERAYLPRLY
jgi:hypothetical protein